MSNDPKPPADTKKPQDGQGIGRGGRASIHQFLNGSNVRLETFALQPRRFTVTPSADGCKRLILIQASPCRTWHSASGVAVNDSATSRRPLGGVLPASGPRTPHGYGRRSSLSAMLSDLKTA